MPNAETPLYVRLLARLVSPFPDFDFGFIKPVRSKAAALLQLSPGSRVLDVGCGSGGSFPYLVQAVGPTGKVVGVELSPASAAHARRRAAKNGWHNVEVLASAAEQVHLADSCRCYQRRAGIRRDVYGAQAGTGGRQLGK